MTMQNEIPAAHAADPEEESRSATRKLTAGTARMASATAMRQILTMGALAVTAAVIARFLGPRSFGLYSGGTAAFNLGLGLCDFGFSALLIRELSRRPDEAAELMGCGLLTQMVWSLLLTNVLFVTGELTGGTRGTVMMVLCPALTFSGLGVSRQIFSVQFRALPLLIMDVVTTLLQCAFMLGLVLLHARVSVLAGNLSAWTCISSIAAMVLARRQTRVALPSRAMVLRFARSAAPIGMASVLASLYFSIDLTLLGWLVTPVQLGRYAAAVRLLNIVVMVPGFIMAAGIPGLTRSGRDHARLSEFASTLARWILISAAPCAAVITVFAAPILILVYGHPYVGAAPLVRILMLAGGLAFVSNVTGITMVTLGIIRPQVIFNTISLTVNVAGNFILVPRYGIIASAWLTVASESIVVAYGVVTLRHRLSYPRILRDVRGAVGAVVLAGLTGLVLGPSTLVAPIAAVLVFLIASTWLESWPHATVSALRRRLVKDVR